MLARLLRIVTLSIGAAALCWLVLWWPRSPAMALTGFAMLIWGHAPVLAIEFVALRAANRGDPAPRATLAQTLRAWFAETLNAARVFCWRQPFFPDRIPDQTQARPGSPPARGVVFVHGFVCNRGFWTPWLAALEREGRSFVAVDLEPVFGSIDDYASLIDAAVTRVTEATGLPPVVICHSMGGLAVRAWLRARRADDRVRHVVTIGSPHHGTWPARWSHVTNGRQMRIGGTWLRELAGQEPPERRALFTCWYSNCDNIVFPASTAALPGAANRFVPGVAHLTMAFCPEIMQATLNGLRRDDWPCAA